MTHVVTAQPEVPQHRCRPIVRPPMHLDRFRPLAFGQVVRRRRQTCELGQMTLARLAGLQLHELADLEENGVLPSLDTAFALADALGTDAAELFHETRALSEELAVEQWLDLRRERGWDSSAAS